MINHQIAKKIVLKCMVAIDKRTFCFTICDL